MRSTVHIAAIVLMTMLGGQAAIAADKVTTVPVHFAKGSSSAILAGKLKGYDTVRYTVGASAGQVMRVKITGSSNANFNVLPAGAIPGQTTAIGSGYVGGGWSGTLPANGTYTIEVYQMRASARRGEVVAYKLQIEVH